MPELTESDVLRLREAQLRGIVDAASEGIVTIDARHTIVMANQMAAEIFRTSVEALVGAPLSQLLPARLRAAHAAAITAFGAADAPPRRMVGRQGVVGLRADGEEFPLQAGISQAHVDGVRLYTVILRDLSEPMRTADALRTTEQLLAATFNVSGVGMAHVDPGSGRFLAVNRAFCQLCGYDEAALLSMTMDELAAPGGRPGPPSRGAPGEPAGRGREQRIVRRDGSVVWVQIAGGGVRDADGQTVRLVCVMQDVTARREAEDALRAREARQSFLVRLNDRLRALDDPGEIALEAARLLGDFLGAERVGYAEDDGNGQTVTVTRSYSRGLPGLEGRHRYIDHGPALLESRPGRATVVRRDVAGDPTLGAAEKAMRAALQIGATVNVPLLRASRVAAVFFVHAAAPRDWRADEVSLIEDVAERVRADVERARAEAGVRAGKATLEAALASMNDAVFIADADGRIVDVNEAFASFHRFADKRQCPQRLDDFADLIEALSDDGTPVPMSQWAVPRALGGESRTSVEYVLRHKRTGERWVGSYSFAPIRDGKGRIVGAVVTARDVTEIKRIRSELEQSHRNLQRLIAAQDRVQEEERLRIARELHDDLQQNLAAILMETGLLRATLQDGDAASGPTLDRIERLAADVIGSMRRIVLDLRPQALEELGLVAALEALVEGFTERSGIAARLDSSALRGPDQSPPAAISTCLYRVAQEALNNTQRHAGAANVTLRLASGDDGRITLALADDGEGFDPARPPRADSLGLLGMRERVRAAGGTLALHSVPGQGTVVEVTLPLHAADHGA